MCVFQLVFLGPRDIDNWVYLHALLLLSHSVLLISGHLTEQRYGLRVRETTEYYNGIVGLCFPKQQFFHDMCTVCAFILFFCNLFVVVVIVVAAR